MMAIDFEKNLSSLSPEARSRVETALQEALKAEGALADAAFDRGPFDRSGFDRSSDIEQAKDFLAKEQGPTP